MALCKNFNLAFFWLFIRIIWLCIKIFYPVTLLTGTEWQQRASCWRPASSQRHYSLSQSIDSTNASTPGFTNSTILSKTASLAHIKYIPLTFSVSTIQIININNFCLFLSPYRGYLLHLCFLCCLTRGHNICNYSDRHSAIISDICCLITAAEWQSEYLW